MNFIGPIYGVLALAILVFAITAIVKAFTRKTTGWIITAILMALLSLAVLAGGAAFGLSRVVGSMKDKKLTSPDGRYSIEVPAAWLSLPDLHEDASIAAGNVFNSQFLTVITESKADLQQMDLAAYAALTTENMAKNLTGSQLGDFESVTISGHPALRRRVAGTTEGLQLVYHHTSVDTGDSLTQIMCWTIAPKEETAFPVFEKVAATFTAKPNAAAPK